MPYAPLDEAVRAVVDETIEHFNANHADTVLLIARHGAGAHDAIDAEAIAVDTEGVEFDVAVVNGFGPGARLRTRAAFGSAVATADEVYAAVISLLGNARRAAGDEYPLTSLEREFARQGQVPTHLAEVLSVRDLTGNLREIVVGGPRLGGYRSVGGDQFVYVLVARPGEELPDDYSMADWMAADTDTRPYGAYYTVRGWDPATCAMTLWAVLHGHHAPGRWEGVGGWFASCHPGDRLAIWGPRAGYWDDGEYAAGRPGDSRHHLFVTDESGFGAVAALIDGLPADDTATVLAEAIDAEHTIEFPGPRTNVRWHYRGAAEPGTGTGLYDLVTELVGRLGIDAIATAFGAGESRQVSAIRRYLRHTAGLPATRVSMTGYWRRS